MWKFPIKCKDKDSKEDIEINYNNRFKCAGTNRHTHKHLKIVNGGWGHDKNDKTIKPAGICVKPFHQFECLYKKGHAKKQCQDDMYYRYRYLTPEGYHKNAGINPYVWTPGHMNTNGLTDCQKDENKNHSLCQDCPSKNACWVRKNYSYSKYVKETKPIAQIRAENGFPVDESHKSGYVAIRKPGNKKKKKKKKQKTMSTTDYYRMMELAKARYR